MFGRRKKQFRADCEEVIQVFAMVSDQTVENFYDEFGRLFAALRLGGLDPRKTVIAVCHAILKAARRGDLHAKMQKNLFTPEQLILLTYKMGIIIRRHCGPEHYTDIVLLSEDHEAVGALTLNLEGEKITYANLLQKLLSDEEARSPFQTPYRVE